MARFTGGSGGGAGTPGPRGPEGDSAYDVAVANGFEGTEQEWLDSLGGGTDNHGDFYFDESTLRVESSIMTIEANEGDGTVAAQIKLTAGDMPIDIASYEQDSTLFGTSDWSTAEWQSDGYGGGQIVITGSTGIIDFLNTSFNGSFQKITVNNEFMSDYNGGSYGGDAATLYVSTGPDGGTAVTITNLTFTWSNKSGITIDYDDQEMNIIANNMQLNIETTGNEDIDITASDDLRLESGDDMFLRSDGYINFVSSSNNNNYEWRMESNGTLEFPARGRLRNPANSSGDGNGYDTFEVIPDFSRYEYDQYLVVDPTQPNHIHVRAGGQQGNSQAELILGGEDTNVRVVDSNRYVSITSQNPDTTEFHSNTSETEGSTMFIGTAIQHMLYVVVDGVKHYVDGSVAGNYYQPYLESGTTEIVVPSVVFQPNQSYEICTQIGGQNWWQFQNDGFLSSSAENSLKVYGLYSDFEYPMTIVADNAIVLNGNGSGEFLTDESIPSNQIATIGDISNAAPVETSFAVNGGAAGTQPTFDGAPLFSGSYVVHGPMVHFQIQVDMDNITSFGSGQYYVDLPFPAKYGYQFKSGCLHDSSSGRQYAIGGHVYAGQSQLLLSYTDSNGQDAEFDYNSPVLLDVADNFHISGDYIAILD